MPQDSIQILLHELKEGVRITHSGGSFETYMAATKNLRNNVFLKRFNNKNTITKEGYYDYQKNFRKEKLDKTTGLQVYVPGFEELLSSIKCPVLALFGEQDLREHLSRNQATCFHACFGRGRRGRSRKSLSGEVFSEGR